MIALRNACCKSKQLLNPDWRLSFEALVSISDFSDESSDGFCDDVWRSFGSSKS